MKKFSIISLFLLLSAAAFGQVVLQQPPGTYTDNSIVRRDGTYNKVQNSGVIVDDSDGLFVPGVISAGSGPTTLTDASGKILSAALNIVAAAQGGFGANISASSGVPLFATGTATFTGTSGTGNFALVNSPAFTTPSLGVASATSINKVAITAPATSATLTIANGKTLTANNSITIAGTDGVTMTTPTTSFTAARTDAANTFTGVQTMTSPATTTSITTASTSFTAWAGATTLLTIGGTGASASLFAPSTLDTTSSTTGAIRTSGGISAAKALNIGTTAGIGTTNSSSTALNLPASTTGVSSLRLAHGTAPTAPVNGDVWTTTAGMYARINGGTVGPFGAGGGSGTVTVVGAGSLTSTALVTGGGTTTLQTPSATSTLDSSGNMSLAGSLTTGSGGGVAGYLGSIQGTAPTPTANSIGYYAPSSVPTAYGIVFPSAPTTGYVKRTGTSSPQSESIVGSIPTTDIATGNLTIGTSGVFTAGTIELGAASDTTLSRSSAGVLAVEGVVVPSISSTNTLTNKRVTARLTSLTSSATPTVNTDNTDCVNITALAAAITSMTTNLTGTPSDFDQLEYRIKDDGTARAITWGASFASGTGTLPTTTTLSKVLHVYFEWDAVQTKWICASAGSEP